METFKAYLQQKRYSAKTIAEHEKNLRHVSHWIKANELEEIENITYNDLLAYVQYERSQDKDVSTINLRISSIRKYFEYLKSEGMISSNPAIRLQLKGKLKKVTQSPLRYSELEKLYHSYKALQKSVPVYMQATSSAAAHERNTIIVGLLVWQGLHSGEIAKLNTADINLHDGTIHIAGTQRSNSRILPLHMQQVLTLHNYIHGGVREKQQVNIKAKEDVLIAGNVNNIVHSVIAELKGIDTRIQNVQHIRSSVLLQWLKQHNKRQVQYMVGHKHIGSTEKYEREALTSVTEGLTKHHPFG
jgi:site-specific recombinase XerD